MSSSSSSSSEDSQQSETDDEQVKKEKMRSPEVDPWIAFTSFVRFRVLVSLGENTLAEWDKEEATFFMDILEGLQESIRNWYLQEVPQDTPLYWFVHDVCEFPEMISRRVTKYPGEDAHDIWDGASVLTKKNFKSFREILLFPPDAETGPKVYVHSNNEQSVLALHNFAHVADYLTAVVDEHIPTSKAALPFDGDALPEIRNQRVWSAIIGEPNASQPSIADWKPSGAKSFDTDLLAVYQIIQHILQILASTS